MTFEDGTSHTTMFETPYEHDIQAQGGLGEALYNACMYRDSRQQAMILDTIPVRGSSPTCDWSTSRRTRPGLVQARPI